MNYLLLNSYKSTQDENETELFVRPQTVFYAAKSQMSAKLRERGCVIEDDVGKLRKAECWDSNQRTRISKVSSPRSNQN